MEQVIFRIKNLNSGGYWNGQGFGTGGKIYTKQKFARSAMTDGRLGNAISNGTYEADKIKVIRAIIIED